MSNEILALKTRYIVVKLILDKAKFPPTKDDPEGSAIRTIFSDSSNESLAIEANITKQEGFEPNHADVTIYGLPNDVIQTFNRFKRNLNDPVAENLIEIYAGYELNSSGMPPFVYKGAVQTAYADYNDPDRPFHIHSFTGFNIQSNIIQATNLKGIVTIDDVIRNIINNSSGYAYQPFQPFTNTITNPNFFGSMEEQLRAVCSQNGLKYKISDDFLSILVTYKDLPFVYGNILISTDTGMIGYPTPSDTSIIVNCYFNPVIQFGQRVTIDSYNKIANGNDWVINSLTHQLQTKGELWRTTIIVNSYKVGG